MRDYKMLVKRVGKRTCLSPTEDQILEMKSLRNSGYTISSIALVFGKHRNTVSKYLNE